MKRSRGRASTSVLLPFKIIRQRDGRSCGPCALTGLLRYYGREVSLAEMKRELGSEHTLPKFPGRAPLERHVHRTLGDGRGTHPLDVFYVLWNWRFTTRVLPMRNLRRSLAREIRAKRPVIALIDPSNSKIYPTHWVVVIGFDEQGVWLADGYNSPTRPLHYSQEDFEECLFGAIAAKEGEDYLVKALARSVQFYNTMASRIAARGVRKMVE